MRPLRRRAAIARNIVKYSSASEAGRAGPRYPAIASRPTKNDLVSTHDRQGARPRRATLGLARCVIDRRFEALCPEAYFGSAPEEYQTENASIATGFARRPSRWFALSSTTVDSPAGLLACCRKNFFGKSQNLSRTHASLSFRYTHVATQCSLHIANGKQGCKLSPYGQMI